MTALERTVAVFVIALLVLLLGMAGGWWRASLHYGPQVTEAARQLQACTGSRSGLEAQVGEQNAQLRDLKRAEQLRQVTAEAAKAAAAERAQDKYAAANRLLQERGGGDDCAAAEAAINRELQL